MNSRAKGAGAERELARVLHEKLGIRLVRNLEQSRRGGHDLIVDPTQNGPVATQLDRYAYEVKRHSRATPALLKTWWKQCCDQAERAGKLPALSYREDRQDWRLRLPLYALRPDLPEADGLEWTADLSLPAFCLLIRES
jgi:Holliday junction resolvase